MVGGKLLELNRPDGGKNSGIGDISISSGTFRASSLAGQEIFIDRSLDCAPVPGHPFASGTLRSAKKERPSALLSLGKGEHRQFVGLTSIVGRAKGLVVLTPVLGSEAADPGAPL